MPETEVTEDAIMGFNRPNVMEAGVPGGGGVMTAGDLALFYQGLLHNRSVDGAPIIKPETLKDALRVRSGDYKDPIFGVKCNRALGVVVAGGDGLANYRGFGKTELGAGFRSRRRRRTNRMGRSGDRNFDRLHAPTASTATTSDWAAAASAISSLAAVCAA